MRTKCIATIVPAVIAAAVLAPTGAFATKISISGTWSRSQIKKDCNAVGGAYLDLGKNGYLCDKSGNHVSCNNRGKCTGYNPRQGNPSHTIGGILRSPSAGIKSSGGGTPPNGHRHPVKFSGFRPPSGVKTTGGKAITPVTVGRTQEHHSGGHK
jgi:hypothetical protein